MGANPVFISHLATLSWRVFKEFLHQYNVTYDIHCPAQYRAKLWPTHILARMCDSLNTFEGFVYKQV